MYDASQKLRIDYALNAFSIPDSRKWHKDNTVTVKYNYGNRKGIWTIQKFTLKTIENLNKHGFIVGVTNKLDSKKGKFFEIRFYVNEMVG